MISVKWKGYSRLPTPISPTLVSPTLKFTSFPFRLHLIFIPPTTCFCWSYGEACNLHCCMTIWAATKSESELFTRHPNLICWIHDTLCWNGFQFRFRFRVRPQNAIECFDVQKEMPNCFVFYINYQQVILRIIHLHRWESRFLIPSKETWQSLKCW